ncbi:MAG: hypothetical protein ACOX2L_08350 [Anaerolineae bacterium]
MRELGLYVSASPEMDPECELLGQTLAQLTPSVRWQIKRTPAATDKVDVDWGALAAADFYVLLVGSDITAPIGVESRAAAQRAIPTFAYRNSEAVPSPALVAFVRQTPIDWTPYGNPQAFATDFHKRIIHKLIDGTPGYGLPLEEIQSLAAMLSEQQEVSTESDDRRGAGRGGVILPANAR